MTKQNNNLAALIMVGILYFIFGFVTWLNGTLIPFLKLTCNLDSDAKSFLVTFAFYMAYFFLAIPSSFILAKTGMKKGMSLGLLVMALGAIIFIPAAHSRSFALFLIGLFVQGMGLSLMQTAVNPYVSILGPIESAAQRISIMGIFNKVAGIGAPIIFGAILLGNAKEIATNIELIGDLDLKAQLLNDLAKRIVNPYIVLTIVLILLAIGIHYSSLPEIKNTDIDENNGNASVIQQENTSILDTSSSIKSVSFSLKNFFNDYPHTILGALAIFFYVGAEVMAGDVIGVYGKDLGISIDATKYFTSITLAAMLVGYLVSLFIIPRIVKQEKWLKISALLGILFAFCAFFTKGYFQVNILGFSSNFSIPITFIALLGFANAVMWPAIFPLGIAGLGKHTSFGSALLIMGIAGGAIVPQIYGLLKNIIGFDKAFIATMIPCYLYILYFATKGYKLRKE